VIGRDELRRTYSRVEGFADFQPGERIWWIYMRNAAIELASRDRLPDLDAALAPLKDLPEKAINERERWLALREVVGLLLEQDASE